MLLGGWLPGGSGPSCGYSHLEDGEVLTVEVQDRVGMVPLAPGGLELVADADTNVGEAVLFTELQSHQGMQSCSRMWRRRRQENTFNFGVVIIRNKQWKW